MKPLLTQPSPAFDDPGDSRSDAPPRRIRPPRFDSIARDYRRKLRLQIAVIARVLGPLVALAGRETQDPLGVAMALHVDGAGDSKEALRRLAAARIVIDEKYSVSVLSPIVQDVAVRANALHEKGWERQARALRFELPKSSEPWLERTLDNFVVDNVSRIKSIHGAYLDDVSRIIQDGYLRGNLDNKTLSEALRHRTGISERRADFIARDQLASLNGQLTGERQKSAGVTRYIWRNMQDERVVGAPGGLYEPTDGHGDHWEREGRVYDWNSPPDDGHPGEAFNCLPGDSQVNGCGIAEVLYRRWYDGELTELVTEGGKTLRATPNHPVLTSDGWRPIGEVQVGENLIEGVGKSVEFSEHDIDRRQPTFSEVFESFSQALPLVRVAGRAMQFHGDGTNQKVDVVRLNGCLSHETHAAAFQEFCELFLSHADATCPDDLLSGPCSFQALLSRLFDAPERLIRGASKLLAIFGRQSLHSLDHRRATASNLDATFLESSPNHRASYAMLFGDRLFADAADVAGKNGLGVEILAIVRGAALACRRVDAALSKVDREVVGMATKTSRDVFERAALGVKLLRVIEKRRSEFSGHVFNLQTAEGLYIADNFVIHNCRCYAEPVFEEVEAG